MLLRSNVELNTGLHGLLAVAGVLAVGLIFSCSCDYQATLEGVNEEFGSLLPPGCEVVPYQHGYEEYSIMFRFRDGSGEPASTTRKRFVDNLKTLGWEVLEDAGATWTLQTVESRRTHGPYVWQLVTLKVAAGTDGWCTVGCVWLNRRELPTEPVEECDDGAARWVKGYWWPKFEEFRSATAE